MGLFSKKQAAEQRKSLDSLALNYISDGVIILGADGVIRLANPAALKIIGHEQEAIVGVSFASAVQLVDHMGKPVPEEMNPVRVAMKTQKEGVVRNLSVLPRGMDKAIPVELVVKLAEGDAILTLRDVTQELKNDAERSEFISTASHEMRTPVASIEGFIGLAINPQTATIDGRARGYLAQAHESAQHLGKLFQDLLDTTGLDDGRLVPRLVPEEMVTAVQKVAKSMEPMVLEKGLSYVFDSGEILGAKVVTPVVYAMVDCDFLTEIIGNLVNNAVKYTPKGQIRVSVRGEEANVVIGVSDTGMGIGPTDLPHVFQKFYRADNSDTRTVGGSGLGLYIVKQRVEAMGGRIWVESKYGEGSQFYFTLPRLTAEEYERRRLALENEGKMVTKQA